MLGYEFAIFIKVSWGYDGETSGYDWGYDDILFICIIKL
jgi:hypothetical protein